MITLGPETTVIDGGLLHYRYPRLSDGVQTTTTKSVCSKDENNVEQSTDIETPDVYEITTDKRDPVPASLRAKLCAEYLEDEND